MNPYVVALERAEQKIEELLNENFRLREALLKLIEKIENRDDLPTEEYRAVLEGQP